MAVKLVRNGEVVSIFHNDIRQEKVVERQQPSGIRSRIVRDEVVNPVISEEKLASYIDLESGRPAQIMTSNFIQDEQKIVRSNQALNNNDIEALKEFMNTSPEYKSRRDNFLKTIKNDTEVKEEPKSQLVDIKIDEKITVKETVNENKEEVKMVTHTATIGFGISESDFEEKKEDEVDPIIEKYSVEYGDPYEQESRQIIKPKNNNKKNTLTDLGY